MFFTTPKKRSKYATAKTPESLKKQKAAIIRYYKEKSNTNNKPLP